MLIISLPLASYGQADSVEAFKPLLRRLHQERYASALRKPVDFPLPVVYRDSVLKSEKQRQLNFELRLADKPLALQHRVMQLRGNGYPVSYSVVFQNCLVAVFKNGKFGCYHLADLTTNEQLEQKLNNGNRGWKWCWLINSKLVVRDSKGYFTYDAARRTWQPYDQPVPFGRQPKLYEDTHYLAYADCQGEFGGNVYFYNKETGQTHRANATCANTLWQEGEQYRLLVSLGHMSGSASSAVIDNPEVLPLLSAKKNDEVNWQYSFKLPENGIARGFDFLGLELFGAIRWQKQLLYLMYWRSTTFLVAIDGSRITIVDPLFANDLFTHNPVTTAYAPDLVVTNLDFYGLGGSDEVATLLWQGQQLTKVEWGKQPNEIK